MPDTMTIENRYVEVEKLIHFITRKFKTKFPDFDYDEMFSEANLAFVESWKGFDPSRGFAFTTYLYRSISNRLISFCREENKYQNRYGMCLDFSIVLHCKENVNWFVDFVDELHADATTVLNLLFESSISNKSNSFWYNQKRTYFRGIGWDNIRIDKAFKEIREALVM